MRLWLALALVMTLLAGCLDAEPPMNDALEEVQETSTTTSETQSPAPEPNEEPEPTPQETNGTQGERGTPGTPVNPDSLVTVLDETFSVTTLQPTTYTYTIPEDTAYLWLHYRVTAGAFVDAAFNTEECVDVSHYQGPTVTAGGPTVNSGSISIRTYYLCGIPTTDASELTISVMAGAFTGQVQIFADPESNYVS